MPDSRPLNVFIAHASQDKPAVRKLYQALKKENWVSPWLDEEEILPGMDWDYEIYKAFRDADVIIACLSQESVAKEGYVQREFKRALSYAEEKPEGTIYVIPLRLDECTPPRKLEQYQWVDYFESNAQQKLLKSLRIRAEDLGILGEVITKKSDKVMPSVTRSVSGSKKNPSISLNATLTTKTASGHIIYPFADIDFLHIPAGDFFMGSDDMSDDAKPEHLVYQLDYDFYIARFPLTNRQYSMMARVSGEPVVISRGKVEHPIVDVSWYDAQEYIKWLNKKHGNELPEGFRFCLPSEAEWEKAARGPEGNEYPWGNAFDKEKCNTTESKIGDTTPVGRFSPQGDSFYGVADMSGNVCEWTRSLWGFNYPYRFDDGRDDENKKAGRRVLRGGSFNDLHKFVRCAFRGYDSPLDHGYDFGFRLCVSPIS